MQQQQQKLTLYAFLISFSFGLFIVAAYVRERFWFCKQDSLDRFIYRVAFPLNSLNMRVFCCFVRFFLLSFRLVDIGFVEISLLKLFSAFRLLLFIVSLVVVVFVFIIIIDEQKKLQFIDLSSICFSVFLFYASRQLNKKNAQHTHTDSKSIKSSVANQSLKVVVCSFFS